MVTKRPSTRRSSSRRSLSSGLQPLNTKKQQEPKPSPAQKKSTQRHSLLRSRSSGTLSATGGNAAVVLELGTRYWRCGYAGECHPRHVVSSPLYRFHDGSSAVQSCTGISVAALMSEEDWRILLSPALRDVLLERLLVSKPSQRCKVLIVQGGGGGGTGFVSTFPAKARRALCRVLLQECKAHSVLFLSSVGDDLEEGTCRMSMSTALALLPTGRLFGLVVDVGTFESRCLAVLDGVLVPGTFHSVPIGYDTMVQHFLIECKRLKLLQTDENENNDTAAKAQRQPQQFIDSRTLFEQATLLCFGGVPPRRTHSSPVTPRAEPDGPEAATCTLPSTGQTTQFPSSLLHTVWNMFLSTSAPWSQNSISAMILYCLQACPCDVRRCVVSNVVLSGGGASTPGFAQRLRQELSFVVQQPQDGEVEVCWDLSFASMLKGCILPSSPPMSLGSGSTRAVAVTAEEEKKNQDDDENDSTRHSGLVVAQTPYDASLLVWLGASILGTCDVSEEPWLTKDTHP